MEAASAALASMWAWSQARDVAIVDRSQVAGKIECLWVSWYIVVSSSNFKVAFSAFTHLDMYVTAMNNENVVQKLCRSFCLFFSFRGECTILSTFTSVGGVLTHKWSKTNWVISNGLKLIYKNVLSITCALYIFVFPVIWPRDSAED